MKYLIMFLLLASCQNAAPVSEVVRGEADLLIYPDANHGVVCYSTNSQNLSCLQLNK